MAVAAARPPSARRVRREWEGGGGQGAGLCEGEPGGARQWDSFLSPKLQCESIERICQREGLELLEVIEELDRSGGDASRPLWNRCIERIERGEAQALVVWNLSRFARSIVDAKRALDRIEGAGGRLLSEEGAEGISRDILLLMAEHERLRHADSFRRAHASAARGLRIEGPPQSASLELLMRRCSRRAPTGVRNRALLAVLWRCGLRIGEAPALKAKDFDPDAGTLVVQRGKGGRRRVVGVDAGTVALVGRWLEVRRMRGIAGGPLFCTLAGRPMDQSYVRHLLPRLARKAGVERRVHAHGLRHAFAVDLVRSGAPLYVVRDALGHTSIATTQVYLSRVGAHEAVDAMRRREWDPDRSA